MLYDLRISTVKASAFRSLIHDGNASRHKKFVAVPKGAEFETSDATAAPHGAGVVSERRESADLHKVEKQPAVPPGCADSRKPSKEGHDRRGGDRGWRRLGQREKRIDLAQVVEGGESRGEPSTESAVTNFVRELKHTVKL